MSLQLPTARFFLLRADLGFYFSLYATFRRPISLFSAQERAFYTFMHLAPSSSLFPFPMCNTWIFSPSLRPELAAKFLSPSPRSELSSFFLLQPLTDSKPPQKPGARAAHCSLRLPAGEKERWRKSGGHQSHTLTLTSVPTGSPSWTPAVSASDTASAVTHGPAGGASFSSSRLLSPPGPAPSAHLPEPRPRHTANPRVPTLPKWAGQGG